jgi:hypothetical protein
MGDTEHSRENNQGPSRDSSREGGHDWPYVIKPRWIHDLLLLWRRKQPYEVYLEQVCDYSVREVRDKTLRRRCVGWIANHFAPSRASNTMTQNVWASYSHHYRTTELASAYLAHLILCEPLAREVTTALHGQFAPGMPMGRGQVNGVSAHPGAIDCLLRTLQQWEVLVADPRQGGYIVDRPLPVSIQVFPLLVWTWWLDARQPNISQAAFAELPLWSCLDVASFESGWQSYVGRLWTVEKDGGEPSVFFHPTDAATFTRSLLNLLSTDGRSGRQLPRHDELSEQLADAAPLREGILGR